MAVEYTCAEAPVRGSRLQGSGIQGCTGMDPQCGFHPPGGQSQRSLCSSLRRVVELEQRGGEGGEEAEREGGGDRLAALHHGAGGAADGGHRAPQEMDGQLQEKGRG